jgi:hypothetical protein
MRKRRWSDQDRHFGPFTWAPRESTSRWLGAILDSGDGENPGCHLRLYLWWITLLIELPPILLPYREKVQAIFWDEATVARMGRNWYWAEDAREFGIMVTQHGHLSVFFGRQTMDSTTTEQWSYFLPFTEWRHIRQSWYGLQGEHLVTLFDSAFQDKTPRPPGEKWRWQEKFEAEAPRVHFDFLDYDGEAIVATTHIDEREWRRGIGLFKWLSWFSKPMVRRTLNIRFSSEVGTRKGSWKGGTVGHSIDLLPGELHEAAFRRYCAEGYQLTFVWVAPAPALA